MKNKAFVLSTIFILLMAFSMSASAGEKKFLQLSLVNPIQLVPEDQAISGIRFNLIYGKNTSVSGLDFGLVNHTTSGLTKGYQFGLVGINEGDFMGFQDHFVNSVKGSCEGFQAGFYNHAGNMNGFQLGFVNHCGTMKGLQIGLINIIEQNGQFPIFPIVNWSF